MRGSWVALSVCFFILPGCSVPKTRGEFREYAPNSSYLKKIEFDPGKLTAATARARMMEYSKSCLHVDVRQAGSISGVPGAMGNTPRAPGHSVYTPTLEEVKGRTTLYLQREEDGQVVKTAEGGMYIFMLELTFDDHGRSAASAYYLSWGASNWVALAENAIAWVQGKDKSCIDLPA
jgi:hypothetical protein